MAAWLHRVRKKEVFSVKVASFGKVKTTALKNICHSTAMRLSVFLIFYEIT